LNDLNSMRSQDSAFGSGRQRKNILRATASEAFAGTDATFDAELVTAGVSKWKIGDTVEVKNYLAQSGGVDDKLLLWAYDDGTFELLPSVAGARNWCTGTASNDGSGPQISNFLTSDSSVFGGYNLGGGSFVSVKTTVDCIGFMSGNWTFRRTGNALYVLRDGTGYVASIDGNASPTFPREARFLFSGPAFAHELNPPALTWYTASNPSASIPLQTVSFAFSTPIKNIGTSGFINVQPSVNIGTGYILLPDYEDENYTINFSLVESPFGELGAVDPTGGVQPLG